MYTYIHPCVCVCICIYIFSTHRGIKQKIKDKTPKQIEDLETCWLSFISFLSLGIMVPVFLSLEYHLLHNFTESCLSMYYISKESKVFESEHQYIIVIQLIIGLKLYF